MAFLTGVPNGAFTIGTSDAVTHTWPKNCPTPTRHFPKAIFAQIGLGFIDAWLSAIALFSLSPPRSPRLITTRSSSSESSSSRHSGGSCTRSGNTKGPNVAKDGQGEYVASEGCASRV
ncbi:hypothetical protein CLCR_07771 [Cladophialophora carrionii]|uniref:Uncharacterized protein n=1 Tax=Cladophialophora carrionii TaxID=86049 RepID=A0A1C1CMK6_9EURO|nr:hypothetical protein CLCR_07771 [Cladophialophora carrionii]